MLELGGALDRRDDVLIPGASAQVAADRLHDGVAVRVRVGAQELHRAHQHAGRAEAALQTMLLPKRLLHRVQRIGAAERLDGLDPRAVCLHCQAKARARGQTVEEHRAGAANPVLAADMGTGEAELMTQKVAQEEAWLDASLIADAVHGNRDLVRRHCVSSRTYVLVLYSVAGAADGRRQYALGHDLYLAS